MHILELFTTRRCAHKRSEQKSQILKEYQTLFPLQYVTLDDYKTRLLLSSTNEYQLLVLRIPTPHLYKSTFPVL